MIGLSLMFVTAILTAVPHHSGERRFERKTLKRIFLIFAVYLGLLALWEPLRPLTTWHWSLGFTNKITETSMRSLLPRIEYLVTFTVLGYLQAEWRGRLENSFSHDIPRLLLATTGISLILELLAGFQVGPGASVIRAMMAIVSALFGGVIYHLLRGHIRILLSH